MDNNQALGRCLDLRKIPTTHLKSHLKHITTPLAKGRFRLNLPLNKSRHREHEEPQTLPRPAGNEQQNQISSKVPPHHPEPVDSTSCCDQTDSRCAGDKNMECVCLVHCENGRGVEISSQAASIQQALGESRVRKVRNIVDIAAIEVLRQPAVRAEEGNRRHRIVWSMGFGAT